MGMGGADKEMSLIIKFGLTQRMGSPILLCAERQADVETAA